jgi:gamma-glutamylaminecyclotransferase
MDAMVFVYGTLKRGFANHAFLAGQRFEGVARTLPHYRLYDNGAHPCMVEAGQQGEAVAGELWRVDDKTLARLDEFEGVPYPFARRQIQVADISIPVFAYLYQGDVAGMSDSGDHWPLTAHAGK